MLYSTGLRVSELVHLSKKDIDFDSGEIKVLGKGSKERVVLLHPAYIEQFKEYVKHFDRDQLLFPLDKGTIEKDIKRMAKVAEIHKHVTPHKLRHSFATHLFKETKNIVLVQELLGHSSISTTQIYTHLDKADLKEGHVKLSAITTK
jgi:site-specific recombinase XerD